MRSVELAASNSTYTICTITEATSEEISILNHDIRELHDDGTHLWVGSKLGVTVIDFENAVSTDYELPKVMICTTWFTRIAHRNGD